MRTPIMVLCLGLMSLVACELEQPCDEYTAYMCDCHDGNPLYPSCEELEATYADADLTVQDECVLALEAQREADDQLGIECGGDTTSTSTTSTGTTTTE